MHLRFARILHIVLSAQALPLICGLLTVLALQMVIVNTDRATKNEEKALVALKSSAAVQKVLLRAIASLAEYSQTGIDADLDGYYKSKVALRNAVQQLQELRASYPSQGKVIGDLQSIADHFSEVGDQIIVLQRLGPTVAPDRLNELSDTYEYGFEQWGRINEKLTDAMQRDFKFSPVGRASYVSTLTYVLLAGLAAVFIACLLTSRMLTTYIAKRLLVVQENSKRLAAGQGLLERLSGEDEISTLDREFHSMAQAISEATFREKDILENATDIILTVDEKLFVSSANAACSRLWSGEGELVGRPFLKLVPEQATQAVLQIFEQCKTSSVGASIEVPLNTNMQATFASISVQWSAENRLFSCVLHDITLLKQAEDAVRQSEQRLKAMLEDMPAGMLLVDENGRVIGCNQVAARLVNKAASDVNGTAVNQLLAIGESSVPASSWLANIMTSGRLVHAITCRNDAMHRPEDVRHFELSVSRVSLSGTAVFLLVILDITANQKLELLRRQLVDGISDAIVSPLQNINATLARVKSFAAQRQDERFSKFADAASQESNRLLKLFSELLEVESSNAQQLTVETRDVSVQEVFERSMAAVRVTAEARGIKLSCVQSDAHVQADPERIVQVLINLIFNALKFTPAGGYVKLEALAGDHGFVELRVLDSGSGIPKGMEEQIFQPFKQTKASDALTKGGSGLGLFICKSIVEKHGGTISAANHSEGAVFKIRLPATQNAAAGTVIVSQLMDAR